MQRVRFVDGAVRDAKVDLVAGANSTEALGTVAYRLVSWTTEVEADEAITLDASQGW